MPDLEKPEAPKKGHAGGLPDEDILKLFRELRGTDNRDRFAFAGRNDFLDFSDPFHPREHFNGPQLTRCLDAANQLVRQRNEIEEKLPQEKKDELRRLRRDLSAATSDADRQRLTGDIEKTVPGAADLNRQAKLELDRAQRINTTAWETRKSSMPQIIDTRVCHQPQRSYDVRVPVDHFAGSRAYAAAAYDSFFKPKPGDQFEARWAQIALESPIVKVAEVLKHLPDVKVESRDWNKLIKIGLVSNGVDVDGPMGSMLERVLTPIESVSKGEGNAFTIKRQGTSVIALPKAVELGAGAKATGIELSTVKFNLGEATYPSIRNLEGVKVKLEIPLALRKIGQIAEETQIREINMTRVPGSGDFEVSISVDNPIPKPVRWLASQFADGVPQQDIIKATLMTLGPDGKRK